ncbi:hypothetical protein DH2020_014404 [Rehmannia glutinosa]|uniref:Uncharacterized protein n=1 Tax=Rehmannia glutinosa TaxID=99300 RepID=A0ABR0WZP1_REHGL
MVRQKILITRRGRGRGRGRGRVDPQDDDIKDEIKESPAIDNPGIKASAETSTSLVKESLADSVMKGPPTETRDDTVLKEAPAGTLKNETSTQGKVDEEEIILDKGVGDVSKRQLSKDAGTKKSPAKKMSKVVGGEKKLLAKILERKKSYPTTIRTGHDFLTQCRPKGLFDVVKSLIDSQIEDVKNIGFGGLLNLNVHHLPAQMIPWLVQRFNGKSRLLSIDERTRFVITADDICDVFLLPKTDREVLVFKRNDSLDPIVEFKKKVGIDGTSSVGTLKSKLMGEFKQGGDDFKRMFVLYNLSTLLTPTANRTVDVSCFKSLLDVDAISHFDWCSLVLERVGMAVDNFNKKSTTHISGCILALQIIYLHRLKWQGVAEPFDLPLIQHWTMQCVRKRVKEERSAREFVQGEWVEDVFPISRKTKPVVEEKISSSTDGGKDERGKASKEHVEKENLRILMNLQESSSLYYRLGAN